MSATLAHSHLTNDRADFSVSPVPIQFLLR